MSLCAVHTALCTAPSKHTHTHTHTHIVTNLAQALGHKSYITEHTAGLVKRLCLLDSLLLTRVNQYVVLVSLLQLTLLGRAAA